MASLGVGGRTILQEEDFPRAASEARSSRIRISIPPAGASGNGALVAHIVDLANDIFSKADGDLWDPQKPKFFRTNASEIGQYLQSSELALVWDSEAAAPTLAPGLLPEPSSCVGCARLRWLDAQTGDISLIACHESLRGQGVGRSLMHFGEDYFRARGAVAVQVDLLVPETRTHPSKARLYAWYTRMGYKVIGVEDFGIKFPRLAPLLAGPSKLQILEKSL